MAGTITPLSDDCASHRLAFGHGEAQATRPCKMRDVAASEMDRKLEDVMACARGALLQHKPTSQDIQAAVAECRARFNDIQQAFPQAVVSADYYVTRARFEEFVGDHEAVADLYAAAAKAGARPRELLQDNFTQYLSRQSVGQLVQRRQDAPSAQMSKKLREPCSKPSVGECAKYRQVGSTTPEVRIYG